ncbi:MAG: cupin domain-containing protein [Armatimonadetes bacterium]|nr:cupin domain-containing protein [Armatimonadota bacterium]NIM24068.1 cupin domain-containing protein [Armatimonadota bacterium]NIM67922.1 cupin domain-containing protein [Armatimonadota bacterium]NIM76444.1 cupin domain-containing protein [Armatimonadota bacterium]NIN06152.1 cupin domain-containing protein [Armatimonadota bacterium]
MKLRCSTEVECKPVPEKGASGVSIRWLLSRSEGAPHFAMRLFELAPEGHTPLHQHPWEHETFMLEGEAEIVCQSGPLKAKAGDAILVEPGEEHQFRNSSNGTTRFLCMIPLPPEH